MYTVASPGPDLDPYPRDGDQLPNPNKCNSTLASGTREEALTPNPNEWSIICGQVSMMMNLPLITFISRILISDRYLSMKYGF